MMQFVFQNYLYGLEKVVLNWIQSSRKFIYYCKK